MFRNVLGAALLSGVLLLGFVVVSDAKAAPTAQTSLCPDPNKKTGKADPDHYFSLVTSGDNSPNQCNSCAADSANRATRSCSVYRTLAGCGLDTTQRCTEQGQGGAKFNIYAESKYRYALAQVAPATVSCHFVVFALDPVIGVDDNNNRNLRNYWGHAFYASQKIVSPAVPLLKLGMAINPATKRGQHQLHIHIGKLKSGYRTALEKIPHDDAFHDVTIAGKKWAGYFLRDQAGPFGAQSPFELVAGRYGEKFMPEEGILVARSKNNDGTYVLAGLNVTTELELDYSGSCTFPKP